MPRLHAPSKEEIATFAPLDRLGLNNIVVVSTAQQAEKALQVLGERPVLGFDTESKPTFLKNEVSQGPHIVQFSTLQTAYVFQLNDAG